MNLDLIKMGGLVEEQLDHTVSALTRYDVPAAQAIIARDSSIDELERTIERKCLGLIALQQPLARDLRTISTALKMITDLERIGDHCADISELIIRMAGDGSSKPAEMLFEMFDKANRMVGMAIDSYMRQDVELAKEMCLMDDTVDELFDKIKKNMVTALKSDSAEVELAINSMFITKYIERIADHATNIGEWAIFMVTGEHINPGHGRY
jgi:phosphate transport system protein